MRDHDVRAAELVGAGARGGYGGGPVRRPPAPRGVPRLLEERPLGDPLDDGPLDPFLDDDLAAVLGGSVDDPQQPADVVIATEAAEHLNRVVEPSAPGAAAPDAATRPGGYVAAPSRKAAPRHARAGRPAARGAARHARDAQPAVVHAPGAQRQRTAKPARRVPAARHALGALPAYRHAAARPASPLVVLAAVVARLVRGRDRIRAGLARLTSALTRPFRQWTMPRLGLASASRVGIVAALGVVTIVAPAAGVSAGPIAPTGTASAGALDLPRARAALVTANYHAIIPDPPSHVPVPGEAVMSEPTGLSGGQLTAISAQAQAVGAAQGHANLPGCTGVVVQQGAENGKLNVADLCELPFAPGKRLRADAALALARMNAEYFVAFGRDMCIGDAYRSYEEQQSVRARKPGLAAPAGMSNHGWALAVDMCDGAVTDTTPEYAWFAANAGKFGWANPEWALQGGRGPHEPWHWEYAAAVAAQRAQAGMAAASGN